MRVEVEAFVLAGGKSSRMKQEKGLVPVNGKPLIVYSLELCEKLEIPAQIVANSDKYKRLSIPLFRDAYKSIGPLGGIFTGLKNAKCDKVLFLTCDMPRLTTFLISELLEKSTEANVVLFETEDGIQPFPCVISKTTIGKLETLINKGVRKTMYAFNELGCSKIWTQKKECFKNINTPLDLLG